MAQLEERTIQAAARETDPTPEEDMERVAFLEAENSTIHAAIREKDAELRRVIWEKRDLAEERDRLRRDLERLKEDFAVREVQLREAQKESRSMRRELVNQRSVSVSVASFLCGSEVLVRCPCSRMSFGVSSGAWMGAGCLCSPVQV